MSAQIIKLSERRKARPAPLPALIALPVAIFAVYVDTGLAIYELMLDAAQQRNGNRWFAGKRI